MYSMLWRFALSVFSPRKEIGSKIATGVRRPVLPVPDDLIERCLDSLVLELVGDRILQGGGVDIVFEDGSVEWELALRTSP